MDTVIEPSSNNDAFVVGDPVTVTVNGLDVRRFDAALHLRHEQRETLSTDEDQSRAARGGGHRRPVGPAHAVTLSRSSSVSSPSFS